MSTGGGHDGEWGTAGMVSRVMSFALRWTLNKISLGLGLKQLASLCEGMQEFQTVLIEICIHSFTHSLIQ